MDVLKTNGEGGLSMQKASFLMLVQGALFLP
jgi:hypothetical protein